MIFSPALISIMSLKHSSGPSSCFIHPRGIASDVSYHFNAYEGRIPPRAKSGDITLYELSSDMQVRKYIFFISWNEIVRVKNF